VALDKPLRHSVVKQKSKVLNGEVSEHNRRSPKRYGWYYKKIKNQI